MTHQPTAPVAVHPITETSYFPDLDEAKASCDLPFRFQFCTTAPLDTPDPTDIRWWLTEQTADASDLFDLELAAEAVDNVMPLITKLADALAESTVRVWQPTGPVLDAQ